jgi:hypothetical protein
MKLAMTAVLALTSVFGLSTIAFADMDVIVKPGETKSIYVSKPQKVNVACAGLPEQPATPLQFFTPEIHTIPAFICPSVETALNALAPEEPTSGIIGVNAQCDTHAGKVLAKFVGIHVGAEIHLKANLKAPYCALIPQVADEIRALSNSDAVLLVSSHCDDADPYNAWIKVAVSRFQ